MKIKILNELAPAPAAPAQTQAPITPAQTPTASASAKTQPHPLDPTVIPIIQKQITDELNKVIQTTLANVLKNIKVM
jgi:hypothetical protein